jgi:hypothetical protein
VRGKGVQAIKCDLPLLSSTRSVFGAVHSHRCGRAGATRKIVQGVMGRASSSGVSRESNKENMAKRDENIATLEGQIKSLLERSSGTVARLDNQISKLDQHLSKKSASKRRGGKARTPATTNSVLGIPPVAGDANPFNKWLVCIAGSDSSRAAESDPLSITRPLTLDEMQMTSPPDRCGSLLQPRKAVCAQPKGDTQASYRMADLVPQAAGSVVWPGQNRETADEQGASASAKTARGFSRNGDEVGRDDKEELNVDGRSSRHDLASMPGQRAPDLSFHAATGLSFHMHDAGGFASIHSPPERSRSPNFSNILEASPVQQAGHEGKISHPSDAQLYTSNFFRKDKRDAIDEDDLRRLEERMEAKIHAFLDSVRVGTTASSNNDVEALQQQVLRLREEVANTKSDVAVALKECRAARVAFASEHWSVKKLLEQLEDLKQTQRQDILDLQKRVEPISRAAFHAEASPSSPLGKKSEQLLINTCATVTRLDAAVLTLQRQGTECAAAATESKASTTALRSLVQEMFEKSDAVQQASARDLAQHLDDSLVREKRMLKRFEELEQGFAGLEKRISSHYLETDEAVARTAKETRKACSKVDELASHVVANRKQTLDIQSDVLKTLDEVKEKWQGVSVQLSAQMHETTKRFNRLRAEVTDKADLDSQKSTKVEEGVRRLHEAISNVLVRVEANENEIRCLDDNILHICSSIHSLQAAAAPNMSSPKHLSSAVSGRSVTFSACNFDPPVKRLAETPATASVTSHCAHSTRSHTTNSGSSESQKQAIQPKARSSSNQDSDSFKGESANSSALSKEGDGTSRKCSPFSSPPILSTTSRTALFQGLPVDSNVRLSKDNRLQSEAAVQVHSHTIDAASQIAPILLLTHIRVKMHSYHRAHIHYLHPYLPDPMHAACSPSAGNSRTPSKRLISRQEVERSILSQCVTPTIRPQPFHMESILGVERTRHDLLSSLSRAPPPICECCTAGVVEIVVKTTLHYRVPCEIVRALHSGCNV